MDEFGETPAFYIWPVGHVPGEPFPDDFMDKLQTALNKAGLEYETV